MTLCHTDSVLVRQINEILNKMQVPVRCSNQHEVKEDIFTLLITLLKTDKETYFITWALSWFFFFSIFDYFIFRL